MSSSLRDQPCARNVEFTDDALVVHLDDGRTICVPLEWFPSLREASKESRENWELIGSGIGIHWPELDEDLSVRGFLALDAGPLPPRKHAALLSAQGASQEEASTTPAGAHDPHRT